MCNSSNGFGALPRGISRGETIKYDMQSVRHIKIFPQQYIKGLLEQIDSGVVVVEIPNMTCQETS